jgi:hypothetical protein
MTVWPIGIRSRGPGLTNGERESLASATGSLIALILMIDHNHERAKTRMSYGTQIRLNEIVASQVVFRGWTDPSIVHAGESESTTKTVAIVARDCLPCSVCSIRACLQPLHHDFHDYGA